MLDGGTSTALQQAGHVLDDAMWTARVLADDPDAVVAVHAAFLAAGAKVVTTASYQLAADLLAATGRDPAEAAGLLARSVAFSRPPRVASLVAAGADVLACETCPSAIELAALARVLAGVATPVYVSVTLGPDGARTAEGQPLLDAFAPLLELDELIAVGVNCCPPELVAPALATLADLPLPLVVKPNIGERYDARTKQSVPAVRGERSGERPPRATEAAAWVAAGARLIGGCCGTGPSDLDVLSRAVASLAEPSDPHGAPPAPRDGGGDAAGRPA